MIGILAIESRMYFQEGKQDLLWEHYHKPQGGKNDF